MEPIAVPRRLRGVTVTKQDPRSPLELVPDLAPVVLDFRAFFAANHRSIASALAMTLRDDVLAADATSEAMTRAYARWDEVGAYTNPAGWVYRVGMNWALSRRRKLVREVFRSDSPERVAPGTAVEPELDAALAALPIDQRTVVVLRYLLDWSEFQTAEALDIAPGTVKSRLSRGLDRLKNLLENPNDH